MKKIFTLLSVALLSVVCLNVQAEMISQELAKQTADNLLSLDSEWKGAGEADVRLVEFDGTPVYYIIEYVNGGWAIISAQSTADPLIGYNPTGSYAAPLPMQDFLNENARKIVKIAELDVEHVGWKRAMQRKPVADPSTTPDIAPLIPTNLNQSTPFNEYCPSIGGQKALVGCVAVATTQAMMVQRFPDQGEGKYTYNDSEGGTGTHTVDFDSQVYDWDAIINCEKSGKYDEAARILYQVGVAVNMMYSTSFSGAFTVDAYTALYRNFRYDKDKLRFEARGDYKDKEWEEKILDDLILGRAVIYQGASNEKGEGGHCWNLDGWKQSTGRFHCNWGWGGHGNGYFSLNDLSDSYQGIELNYYHAAVFGVGVPTTAPYAINLSKTKFVAGTAAGVALADVTVLCEDEEAVISYEMFGPNNLAGKPTISPYEVKDGKLVSNKTIANTNAFKYLKMKVTNTNTGESFEKEFYFQIVEGDDAVETVLSDAMRVYPSVANDALTIEVPAVGGEYAIYSVSGAQVSKGELAQYKTDVNVSNLAAGTYILRYVHNSGVGVKTFVKK